jgi:uncharacterized protein
MKKSKNILISGEGNRQMAVDIFCGERTEQPLVIYAHGFNGFKDWGNFDLLAECFADAGFSFVKFNFSHNGTTPDAPEDFVDTEAYGHNNYTTELNDLQRVIDWAVSAENPFLPVTDTNNIFLLGHSRGGGIVLLKAAEEKRIKAVATWASVGECKTPWGSWPEERIQRWKETGIEYYNNSRTQQQLPLYYQLMEDYQNNKQRLDIVKAVESLNIPVLICHGTKDEAVPVEKAYTLQAAAKQAQVFIVESDHVFGRRHPNPDNIIPLPMQEVVSKTIVFFQSVAAGKF